MGLGATECETVRQSKQPASEREFLDCYAGFEGQT